MTYFDIREQVPEPTFGGREDGAAALAGAAAALGAGGSALGLGLGGRVLLALLVRHLADDQAARLDLLIDEVELLLALVGVPIGLCFGRHTSLRVPGAPGVLSLTGATAPARARKAPLSGSFPRQSVRQTRRRSVSRAVVSSRAKRPSPATVSSVAVPAGRSRSRSSSARPCSCRRT